MATKIAAPRRSESAVPTAARPRFMDIPPASPAVGGAVRRPAWRVASSSLQRPAFVLAGERAQKKGDQADLFVRKRAPELHARHGGDRLLHRRDRSIVEIGRRDRDVPQARDAEDLPIGWIVRHLEAPELGGCRLFAAAIA